MPNDYIEVDEARVWLHEWFGRWISTLRAAAAYSGYDEDGISQLVMRLYSGNIIRRVSILSLLDEHETEAWIYGTVRRYSRYTDTHIIAGRMRLYSKEYEDTTTRGVE